MKALAVALWGRAKEALQAAKLLVQASPDAAGSRAYYAAFYAVSACFALHGRTFRKHSSVEAAVHRDLVKAGHWSKELGAKYSVLVELRTVGNYGDFEHISPEEAEESTQIATDLLCTISLAESNELGDFPAP